MTRDEFETALEHLRQGNFTSLAPCFTPHASLQGRSRVEAWLAAGRFGPFREEALEALSCAAFLGADATLRALLDQGLPAAGGSASGMGALHYAASRGRVSSVRLLLERGAPLEARNRYGGTALAQTVWSALHEPMPGQREALELLLAAGAELGAVEVPTGAVAIDALLARASDSRRR